MAGFVVVITVFYENLHIEFCEGVDIPNCIYPFFNARMRSLFPDAKKPNRNPGTPYDFDMLLMTIKCGYLFKSSLSNRESLFSGFAKSRKDSSMIKRIPFSFGPFD